MNYLCARICVAWIFGVIRTRQSLLPHFAVTLNVVSDICHDYSFIAVGFRHYKGSWLQIHFTGFRDCDSSVHHMNAAIWSALLSCALGTTSLGVSDPIHAVASPYLHAHALVRGSTGGLRSLFTDLDRVFVLRVSARMLHDL